jgi:hypothetical protein
MKVYQALDILKEIDGQEEVYCLIYIREDAETQTEDKPPLTDTEWWHVVRGLESVDEIDTDAYDQFRSLVDQQLQARDKVNAN